jgi:metal-responsive CopG/Arc/MetJ family transcriptional regulator
MHRTQLYLDDDLYTTLKARAQQDGTSISELVRVAARDRYSDKSEQRKSAMLGIVGLWKDRADLPDTETYIRNLRDDDRIERLGID